MLVVLVVIVRSRADGWFCRGVPIDGGVILGAFVPNEKVLPAARSADAKDDSGIGGTGRSWVEWSEGRVEEELNLADEELSYSLPVDEDVLVPPLPVEPVNFPVRIFVGCLSETY